MEFLIKTIAVILAMVIGHPIMFWLTEVLRGLRNEDKLEGEKPETKKSGSKKISVILGYIERGLVATIWFWGHYEFIGFWFAGKVIGNWDRRDDKDRGAFGSYLIATVVSISLAVIISISAEQIIKLISK